MRKPIIQALVLADHVYQDRRSGKMVIAGTFTKVVVRRKRQQDLRKPRHPKDAISIGGSPWLYVCVTNVQGTIVCELRYVDLKEFRVLFSGKLTIECKDPLLSKEFFVPIPCQLPTPHDGAYALEILYDEEPLAIWRVSIEGLDENEEQ